MKRLTRRNFLADCILAGGALGVGGCIRKKGTDQAGTSTPGTDPAEVVAAAERAPLKAASEPESFTFAVLSDPHCQTLDNVPWFLRCGEMIGELTGDDVPDFALICGDLEFHYLDRDFPDLHLWDPQVNFGFPCPLHVVHGNAGTNAARRQMIRNRFTDDFKVDDEEADYYSVVHKDTRFIALSNASYQDHIGHLCSSMTVRRGQIEWLAAELAKPEPRKIVFGHIPPSVDSRDEDMWMAPNDNKMFTDLVAQYPPTAMFFGHRHRYEESTIGGQPCYQAPTTWDNFQPPPNIGARAFLLVRMNAASVTVQRRYISGV